MDNSEHLNYKKENIEGKYLNNMLKTQFSKVKNSLLAWKNDITELKDRELKEREIEELFSKPITNSIDDMEKF